MMKSPGEIEGAQNNLTASTELLKEGSGWKMLMVPEITKRIAAMEGAIFSGALTHEEYLGKCAARKDLVELLAFPESQKHVARQMLGAQ